MLEKSLEGAALGHLESCSIQEGYLEEWGDPNREADLETGSWKKGCKAASARDITQSRCPVLIGLQKLKKLYARETISIWNLPHSEGTNVLLQLYQLKWMLLYVPQILLLGPRHSFPSSQLSPPPRIALGRRLCPPPGGSLNPTSFIYLFF